MSDTIPVDHLEPADLITEIGTPRGPWYLVQRLDREKRVIVLSGGIEIPLEPSESWILRHSEKGLGTYRALSCRDGESIARDGQPYVEINTLTTNTRTTYEVRFPDGMWLLAAPEDLLMLDAATADA